MYPAVSQCEIERMRGSARKKYVLDDFCPCRRTCTQAYAVTILCTYNLHCVSFRSNWRCLLSMWWSTACISFHVILHFISFHFIFIPSSRRRDLDGSRPIACVAGWARTPVALKPNLATENLPCCRHRRQNFLADERHSPDYKKTVFKISSLSTFYPIQICNLSRWWRQWTLGVFWWSSQPNMRRNPSLLRKLLRREFSWGQT